MKSEKMNSEKTKSEKATFEKATFEKAKTEKKMPEKTKTVQKRTEKKRTEEKNTEKRKTEKKKVEAKKVVATKVKKKVKKRVDKRVDKKVEKKVEKKKVEKRNVDKKKVEKGNVEKKGEKRAEVKKSGEKRIHGIKPETLKTSPPKSDETIGEGNRILEKREDRLIIRDIEVAATAFNEKQLVMDSVEKVVFIGRSNVGKSSLINKLLNRKRLARTSSKPGKTVSINYFLINEGFYFVDLPGYGYAKISKQETRRVRALISSFFEKTPDIRLIVILIDSRRGFMDPDLEILEQIINKDFKLLTVLTKSDKLRNSELIAQKKILQSQYDLTALSFSIKSSTNREEILNYINQALME